MVKPIKQSFYAKSTKSSHDLRKIKLKFMFCLNDGSTTFTSYQKRLNFRMLTTDWKLQKRYILYFYYHAVGYKLYYYLVKLHSVLPTSFCCMNSNDNNSS